MLEGVPISASAGEPNFVGSHLNLFSYRGGGLCLGGSANFPVRIVFHVILCW
jgi:hypothetical protein